jgi:uncharacterized protein involved in outer membrane biogenesis
MPDALSSSSTTSLLHRWKTRKKAAIALGLGALFSAAILIVPHFIDLGRFKQTYLPSVENALQRPLDVGEVRLSLVPTPALRLSNLKVFETPDGGRKILFSAEQVRLRLRLWPLLNGRFEVSELVLERPVLNLSKLDDAISNDSLAGANKALPRSRAPAKPRVEAKTAEPISLPPPLPGNVTIRDGELNFLSKGNPPVRINGIDLLVREFSAAAPFPFRASLSYPGLKNIALEGELDYQLEQGRLQLRDSRMKINQLTLLVQGHLSDVAAQPRLDLDLKTDHGDAQSILHILSVLGLAPGEVDAAGPMELFLSVSGPVNNLVTRGRGLLKDVRVHGRRFMKGRLSGEVSVLLPIESGSLGRRLQGSGKLASRDGELTNIDLIKKIERATGMIGLSRAERREAVTFERMEADFKLANGYAEFTRLYLFNRQLEVNGAGTMSLEQPTLDMALTTALSPKISARAGHGRMTGYFKNKRGRIVVPLKVRGPLANPTVDLDAGKIAQTGMPQSTERGFSALLKRLFR